MDLNSKLEIKSELAAQRIDAQPNPMVQKTINFIKEIRPKAHSVADQGCGKLRHLDILLQNYSSLFLVDTEAQLTKVHKLRETKANLLEFVSTLPIKKGRSLKPIRNTDFSKSSCKLDVIFNIATFDVVLESSRIEMIESALQNLKTDGLFVLIIPRNDSSILRRCTDENRFEDGYVFHHHGAYTFFKNFRDSKLILEFATSFNLKLIKDMSVYRHICLILNKC